MKIKTAAATAAVTGFTAIYEFHNKGVSKFMLLDGHVTLQIKGLPTPCVFDGGHMIVIPRHPIRCPDILPFDVEKVLKSAKLTIKPLPQWALDPILAVIEDQKTSPPPGGFTDPTTIDTHDQAANAMPSATPPRHETPPPKRF